MHFCLDCNMNKFSRVFVYILVLVATGADKINSKYEASTTATKWKEPTTTTKEKETTTSASWKQPTTSTSWKQPNTTTSWKRLYSSSNWKQPTTTTSWNQSTTNKWKQPSTTTSWKQTTTNKWKQPSTTTSWKQTTTNKWNQPTTTTKSKPTTLTTSWKKLTTTKWNDLTTKATPTKFSSSASVNNGVFAVASISGLDARNARLSSMNGIKIYPETDSSMVQTDDKGNFIFKSVDGKMPMPITITKEGDGVSGIIRILPGSVSVSSSASSSSKSGPAAPMASFNPWPSTYMKPLINDIYMPPFPTFPTIPEPDFTSNIPDTSFNMRFSDPFPYMRFPEPSYRSQNEDPWLSKNRYNQPQQRHNIMQPNWYYPTFSPFINYW